MIVTLRGERVILDSDLAKIYGVETRRLNEQVRRNITRFPEDFAIQLTEDEFKNLISQNATSKGKHGGRRKLPLAFTEHGAIMAANVLNSSRAVQMSVFVVRAFIKMRDALANNKILAQQLSELEGKLITRLDLHEKTIIYILNELKKLSVPPPPLPKKRPIGFARNDDDDAQSISQSKRLR
ncbi:MAG: ORF6N domain-containing protein [Ignavibacteriae bacterium]|nr:ORF6N domain-containing protein [Ignavibacteriota bacterium]